MTTAQASSCPRCSTRLRRERALPGDVGALYCVACGYRYEDDQEAVARSLKLEEEFYRGRTRRRQPSTGGSKL